MRACYPPTKLLPLRLSLLQRHPCLIVPPPMPPLLCPPYPPMPYATPPPTVRSLCAHPLITHSSPTVSFLIVGSMISLFLYTIEAYPPIICTTALGVCSLFMRGAGFISPNVVQVRRGEHFWKHFRVRSTPSPLLMHSPFRIHDRCCWTSPPSPPPSSRTRPLAVSPSSLPSSSLTTSAPRMLWRMQLKRWRRRRWPDG